MKGIPYMGSKRRIAPDLIRHMANSNPDKRGRNNRDANMDYLLYKGDCLELMKINIKEYFI